MPTTLPTVSDTAVREAYGGIFGNIRLPPVGGIEAYADWPGSSWATASSRLRAG
jgi:hypothetical protein